MHKKSMDFPKFNIASCIHGNVKWMIAYAIYGLFVMTFGVGSAFAKNAVGKVRVFKDCDVCSEMVVLPRGEFVMGATDADMEEDDDEYRLLRHQVNIAAFALGKTPVTRAQFAAFVSATNYHDDDSCYTYEGKNAKTGEPSEVIDIITDGGPAKRTHRNWRNPGFTQTNSDPVVCLSWNDAKAYVRWVSEKTGQHYRLPTEAEWEYAARAGTTRKRYWGNAERQQCRYENALDSTAKGELSLLGLGVANCSDGFAYTSPVGSFKPNALGLYDMLGNVYQWTEDCFDRNYAGAPTDGSAWIIGDCEERVLRGGSWHTQPIDLSIIGRFGRNENDRYNIVGLRIARDFP